MTSLSQKLTDIVGGAFEACELPRELGVVRVSDRPDLAQFQCNGAMAAAKQAKCNPREVAQKVINYLTTHHCHPEQSEGSEDSSSHAPQNDSDGKNIFFKIEIAGPGFINLNLSDDYIQNHLDITSKDERFGVPKTGDGQIILDYGGMNVAKAMHVGHLRPSVIGDCLRSLMRFAGYDALGDIHLGDWGLQMGQIISEFEIRNPEWPYFDESFTGSYPDEAPFDYSELEKIYPEASAACKEDKDRLDQARKATAELQEERAGYVALWEHFIKLSIEDIKDNLAPLGIDFDIWKGEACVAPLVPDIAEDLDKRTISELSDGATIIRVDQDDDNKKMPPLIFLKSDGAMTYGTTDIATIYERTKLYPDLKKIIYIVDKRQSLHFEQVFRACHKAGYTNDIELHHVGNGTVNGPDGKPFKTREGKALTFRKMVETVIDEANKKLDEANLAADFSEEERKDISSKVARAALRFSELSNQPHMDYVFNIERMTAFEGKTGPYLLYQSVRIKSLLKKAEEQGIAEDENAPLKIDDADRDLALLLTEYPDAMALTLRNYAPHHLCDYVYKVSQAFSSFYGNCHILSEENEELRASRLRLCQMTVQQIDHVLSLLGIDVPERM